MCWYIKSVRPYVCVDKFNAGINSSWTNNFLLEVIFQRTLFYINRLDDLIKTALDFSSCAIPREITFHVVLVFSYFCAEKVASSAHVFPYSRNTASVYFANFLFISRRVCHPVLSANLMLILCNDKSNYSLIVVFMLVVLLLLLVLFWMHWFNIISSWSMSDLL